MSSLSGLSGPLLPQKWTIEGMGLEWLFDETSLLAEDTSASDIQESTGFCVSYQAQSSISQDWRGISRGHSRNLVVGSTVSSDFSFNDHQTSLMRGSNGVPVLQASTSHNEQSSASSDRAVQGCSDRTRSARHMFIDSGYESVIHFLLHEVVNINELDAQQSVS